MTMDEAQVDRPMNLLLFCYDFPPSSGIGGRRWAKLAKGLALEGHLVHVVCAEPLPDHADSPWTSDIEHPNISVHRVERKYPRTISHGPRNFTEKIRYRIDLFRLKQAAKGTVYDQALHLEQDFLKTADQIINQHAIDAIAATGAPFKLLYYAALVKEKYPTLTFIADYRDPWLQSKFRGMTVLSERRKAHELEMEELVYQQADKIISPFPRLTANLKSAPHATSADFYTLAHFYDPDDLPSGTASSTSNEFEAIYGGTVYSDSATYLSTIPEALSEMEDDLARKVRFTFHTASSLHGIDDGFESSISVRPMIGKAIFERMRQSQALILILPESMPHERTSKFYELLSLETPILYFGPPGEVSQFIEEKGLGKHITTKTDLLHFIDDCMHNRMPSSSVDISGHALKARTQELLQLIAAPVNSEIQR
jgi:glycosyltransferase involved in cell wall biosynthesis